MIMKWINGFEMDKWLNLDYKMKKDLDIWMIGLAIEKMDFWKMVNGLNSN